MSLPAYKYIVHICISVYVLHITYLSQPGSSLFSFHPMLMSLAFGFFMTESILTFTNLSFRKGKTLKDRVYIHWILNVCAGLSIILGFLSVYINKEINGKEHFVSYHGLVGLISCCYALVQMIAGVFAKYPLWLKFCIKARPIKMLHSFSGLISYMLGITALVLSFDSNWLNKNMHYNMKLVYLPLFPCIVLYVFKGVVSKLSAYLNRK